jgi:uncharacterized protein YfdQ (DUF2303 family)
MLTTDGNQKQPATNAEAAVEAGISMADIASRIDHIGEHAESTETVPVALVPNGMKMHVLKDVVEALDERAEKPRRLTGTAHHSELASFIAHVNRFKDGDSAIFADTARVQLTAVLDYHQARNTTDNPARDAQDLQRWGSHRSVYTCPLSDPWKLWTSKSGVDMSQEAFAQFIEDNMVDLANPAESDDGLFPKPAAVLEMARNLAITVNAEFQRSINPTTGESTLINKSEHGPKSTKIPKAFLLGIPVFDAGQPYRVEARLRFALTANGPRFAYVLYQADAIKRDAFKEVRDEVAKGTSLPIFAGSPEQ